MNPDTTRNSETHSSSSHPPPGTFPQVRLRRLRKTPAMRAAVAETAIRPEHLVQPLFVVEGTGIRTEIATMPGQFQLSADNAGEYAKSIAAAGVGGIIVFGIPDEKDAVGSGASDPKGPVAASIEAVKAAVPELIVWADVCLCEYTDHGHCGVVDTERQTIANDPTLEHLASAAVVYAQAGADVVAPSDMMDGRVGAIRSALDAAGREDVIIVSYAAKYASVFYGPFREAAQSTPRHGDRRQYQMDPANAREAMREIALDIAEGADIVMVKPAGPYLDVIRQAADRFDVPLAAYQVSGEYAMIRAAADRGWLDEERAILESIVAIRRAGATLVLTYFAKELAEAL